MKSVESACLSDLIPIKATMNVFYSRFSSTNLFTQNHPTAILDASRKPCILPDMDIRTYLADSRTLLSERLRSLANEYSSLFSISSLDTKAAINRILDYTLGGKMIRGSLVLLGYTLFSSHSTEHVIDAGCAMEFFQSGLLIHDDIMDCDETRRGSPTMHVQYRTDCHLSGSREPQHGGEALAICSGDICFFLGQECFSKSLLHLESVKAASRLISFSASELAKVGFAQMQDVRWGLNSSSPSEAEVNNMYRYKTARYTFSMPLVTGALFAGADQDLNLLETFGESLGIAFQLKDDDLGLFGNEQELGKPTGSDIREGKKTIFMTRLRKSLKGNDLSLLNAILGNPDASDSDIHLLLTLPNSIMIRNEILNELQLHVENAYSILEAIEKIPGTSNSAILLLKDLIRYIHTRSK